MFCDLRYEKVVADSGPNEKTVLHRLMDTIETSPDRRPVLAFVSDKISRLPGVSFAPLYEEVPYRCFSQTLAQRQQITAQRGAFIELLPNVGQDSWRQFRKSIAQDPV